MVWQIAFLIIERDPRIGYSGCSARVQSKDTRRNFRATIEVPAQADLVIHLTAGELAIELPAPSRSD